MKFFAPLYLSLALVVLFGNAGIVYADRDIVYAARYYLAPGSSGTSHFHLYRINADGSGKTQVTFGDADDNHPRWSPDGRKLLFIRTYKSDRSAACIVNANGSDLKKLPGSGQDGRLADCRWSPNGRSASLTWDNSVTIVNLASLSARRLTNATAAYWSPNSEMCYIVSTQGPDRVLDLTSSKTITIKVATYAMPFDGHKVIWRDNYTLVGIGSKLNSGDVFLTTFDLAGKTVGTTHCIWPHSKLDPYLGSVNSGSRSLMSLPFKSKDILYIQDKGISSSRPDNAFWLANTVTGKMISVSDSQFVAWSPDGKRYCSSPARHLADYAKSKKLYVSSLQVSANSMPKSTRTLAAGLVWVTGADWRSPVSAKTAG